jgi:hypothetical protein
MRIGSKLLIGLFRPYEYCKAPGAKGPYSMYGRFLSANPAHAEVYPSILECWILKNVLGEAAPVHLRVHPSTGVLESFDDYMRPYL